MAQKNRGNDLNRRDFLKYAGVAAGAAMTGLSPLRAFGAAVFGRQFIQQVNRTRLYMTHYATFEEPDPIVPAAIYFNELGQPTNELSLLAPVYQRTFTRSVPNPTVL